MSINLHKKFLVLKSNIIEQENNLRHQIFRRKRFRIIIEIMLDFLSLLDIMSMLKLNKNISNIIKEKNYLSKVPALKQDLYAKIQKTLRYNNFPKIFQIDFVGLSYSSDEKNLNRIVLPVYFAKKYLNDETEFLSSFTDIHLGSLGGEILAYYIKLSNKDTISFDRVREIEKLFGSYYYPDCTSVEIMNFNLVTFSTYKPDVFKNLFQLKNLKTLKISQANIYSTSLNLLLKSIVESGTKIDTLSLVSNKIGGECGVYFKELIKHNQHLLHLFLDSNEMNGAGLISLASALDSNSTLETLSLARNSIKDTDAKDFFLSLWKTRPKSLKTLILNYNSISKKGIKMAGKFIKRKDCPLENFQLNYNRISKSDAKKLIAKIKATSKLTKIGLLYHYSDSKELKDFLNRVNDICELNIILDTACHS